MNPTHVTHTKFHQCHKNKKKERARFYSIQLESIKRGSFAFCWLLLFLFERGSKASAARRRQGRTLFGRIKTLRTTNPAILVGHRSNASLPFGKRTTSKIRDKCEWEMITMTTARSHILALSLVLPDSSYCDILFERAIEREWDRKRERERACVSEYVQSIDAIGHWYAW